MKVTKKFKKCIRNAINAYVYVEKKNSRAYNIG